MEPVCRRLDAVQTCRKCSYFSPLFLCFGKRTAEMTHLYPFMSCLYSRGLRNYVIMVHWRLEYLTA